MNFLHLAQQHLYLFVVLCTLKPHIFRAFLPRLPLEQFSSLLGNRNLVSGTEQIVRRLYLIPDFRNILFRRHHSHRNASDSTDFHTKLPPFL